MKLLVALYLIGGRYNFSIRVQYPVYCPPPALTTSNSVSVFWYTLTAPSSRIGVQDSTNMSQSDHGRHSMSRRKPVPKFIPSPPPSPPSSPGAPFGQISFASGSLAQTDMPPLPEDWRDVIDRMVSKERHSTLPTINTVVDGDVLAGDTDGEIEGERQSQASTEFGTTRSFTFAPPSPCETCDGEAVPRPDSPTPWSRPVSKRRGQGEYRPPTPPLPRQHSRSPTLSAESPTVATSHGVSDGKMALMSLPKAINLKPRSLPPIPMHNGLKPNISLPLPAPRPVRPLPDVRKVPLPTPPPSWSTHEHPISRSPSNRGFVSSERVSPTLRSASPTQTPSPSTPYSEKNISRSTRATSVKSGQHHPHNPSVEQMRAKNEVSTVSKSLPARPGTLRQALARGLDGLKRLRALVASAILCRS